MYWQNKKLVFHSFNLKTSIVIIGYFLNMAFLLPKNKPHEFLFYFEEMHISGNIHGLINHPLSHSTSSPLFFTLFTFSQDSIADPPPPTLVPDPSPDWIVGVSALELCLRNCSWVESKVLNLYPWDAGTDSGVTYIVRTTPY